MISKKVLSFLLCSAILQSTVALSTLSVSAEQIESSQAITYTQESASNNTSQTTINITKSQINSLGFEQAVQSALNTARDNATASNIYKIVVPAGSYTIKNSLKLYSNTYLTLTGVTLTRSTDSIANIIRVGTTDSASSGATGYSKYSNITVDGGTLNGSGTRNTIVKFAHGTNISLINTTLSNVRNGHIMEVAGINGFTVKNCNFSDQILDSSLEGYEAIQLDVLVQSHFPGYRSEDIPMKNVLIEGCSFKNCPRGIGSHTAILNNPFDGIKIKNCKFENIGSVAIQGQNWINCEITDNTINNAPRGIAIYSTMEKGKGTYTSKALANEGNTTSHVSNSYTAPSNHNIKISNNKLIKCGHIKDVYATYESGGIFVIGYDLTAVHSKYSDGSGGLPIGNYYVKGVTIQNNTIDTRGHGIRLVDTKSVTVSDNTIECLPNTFDNAKYHGIYVYSGEADSITNNRVTNATLNGIYVYNQSNVTNISNNTISNANNYGISIDKSKATSINNNTINQSVSNSIHISNGSTVSTGISGNFINDSGYHGISVVNASRGGTISGNTICNPARKNINIGSDSSATTGTNYDTVVSSVSLNKTSITLGVGEKYTLTKTVTPSNVACTWSSSNTSVATVDSNGEITAKSAGSSTIIVKTADGKTASCVVTVKNAPNKISLNKKSITLGVGETFDLNSTLPSGTASYSVKYSSNNTNVASVASSGGLVTAKASGTATITATTYNGKKATCTVTVKNAPSKVSLNISKITLGVGETFDLNSSLPSGTASYSVKYSSNNTNAVDVASSGGLITAKRTGTATITATTYNGKTATCTVTVKNVPNSISLNIRSISLGVGEAFNINSTLPRDTASYNIKYSSNNTNVASVIPTNGIVNAKAPGTVTITATTHNGKTATCTIVVKNAPSSISLNKPNITLGVGEKFDLNHSLPSGTASCNIRYSSNNTGVAKVAIANGVITAKNPGTAIITAKTHNGKTTTCTVTVKNEPNSISLNTPDITLGVGEKFDLNHLLPSDTASYSVRYSSTNTGVVTVASSNGIITAKNTGIATITATTYNGKTANCIVTVKNAPNQISLNPTTIILNVGETFELNSVLPSDTASYRIKYSSSDTSIATVNASDGVVTAIGTGTATITAKTFNGKTATCEVIVN